MNNKTQFEIKIKLRGDGVYDVYVNKQWMMSKGNIDTVIESLRTLLPTLQMQTEKVD